MTRSIKDSLSEATLRFVKEGLPPPPATSTEQVVDLHRQQPAAPLPAPSSTAANAAQPAADVATKKRAKSTRAETTPLPEHRVPVSTRLPAALVYELKRAALRRELDDHPPFTLQAILEVAAEEWLKQHALD